MQSVTDEARTYAEAQTNMPPLDFFEIGGIKIRPKRPTKLGRNDPGHSCETKRLGSVITPCKRLIYTETAEFHVSPNKIQKAYIGRPVPPIMGILEKIAEIEAEVYFSHSDYVCFLSSDPLKSADFFTMGWSVCTNSTSTRQNRNCYWWHVHIKIIHQDLWNNMTASILPQPCEEDCQASAQSHCAKKKNRKQDL